MKITAIQRQLKMIVFLVVSMFCIEKNNAQSNLNKNELNQWFLSTDDWGKNPQIYVREIGIGTEPVIMLHGGWGAEHSGLINAIKGLKNEYRFIFYDQRGSLRSPFPDSLISFEQHINDLELLRQELNLDKMTILGHSMGAILASAYASKYPQYVQKLILVSPAHLKNPFPQDDKIIHQPQYAASQKFQNRIEITQELQKYNLLREGSSFNSREETIKSRINFGKLMLYDISKWTELSNGKALYKRKVHDLTIRTYPKDGWNYYAEFKKQNYPVSIIIGDHDWLDFGNNLNKKWSKEVPRIKMTSIKNAGHIPWIDQPLEFTNQLRIYLK